MSSSSSNKTVQQQRQQYVQKVAPIEIVKGPFGKGMRATRDIKKGERFLAEAPFAFSSKGDITNYPTLTKYANDLDAISHLTFVVFLDYKKKLDRLEKFVASHSKDPNRKVEGEKKDSGIYQVIAKKFKKPLKFVLDVARVIMANGFTDTFDIDTKLLRELAIYDKASFADHRCVDYNTEHHVSRKDGRLAFVARRDIHSDEWITVSYTVNVQYLPKNARQELMLDTHKFQCRCEDCVNNHPGAVSLFGKPDLSFIHTIDTKFSTENFDAFLEKNGKHLETNFTYAVVIFDALLRQFEAEADLVLLTGNQFGCVGWPELLPKNLETLVNIMNMVYDKIGALCYSDFYYRRIILSLSLIYHAFSRSMTHTGVKFIAFPMILYEDLKKTSGIDQYEYFIRCTMIAGCFRNSMQFLSSFGFSF